MKNTFSFRKGIFISVSLIISSTSFASATHGYSYKVPTGVVEVPASSIEVRGDIGKRSHTNIEIFHPNTPRINGLPGGETPASLACVYGFVPQVPGCPIASTTIVPTGGWGTIALVDAYDDSTAEADLGVFSATFGLPACTTANGCFSRVFATGKKPDTNTGWQLEETLDIEWAHAMAPNAKIVLVEAATSSNSDLLVAEAVASQIVSANGGGEISNSWGGTEDPTETSRDSYFTTPGIVYLASAGDSAAPATYPSSSPNVISAGGTAVIRSNGNFVYETGWNMTPDHRGGSGGPSIYESRPVTQNTVMNVVGTQRGTPDIAFDADPKTGVDIYSSQIPGGWTVIGGTSVASPSLAGVINSAGGRATSTFAEASQIYSRAQAGYHSYWHDITSGYNGYPALSGYDFVTGLGSPNGYLGV
jgi:subtilase family serine protease